MKTFLTSAIALAGLAAASTASAQDATDSDSKTFAVTGNVPALCSGGTLDGSGAFDFGVLIDTTTGLLRDDLSANEQTLTAAFCSTRSTISVEAEPMLAQNYVATPPAGFSRSVDFVATASGWTPSPAIFDTGAAANASAVQQRDSAFNGDIAVAVDTLSVTGGDNLLLVADTEYLGSVVVTLAAQN